MSALEELTAATFSAAVRDTEGAVVVDFHADWCVPCRMMDPVLAELAGELGDQVRVVAVDTEAEPDLARDYGVVSLPTLQLWRAGELVEVVIGARPKAELRATIRGALLDD